MSNPRSPLSFQMRVPNADYFSDLIKSISAVVEEGTFVIDPSSLKLAAMDPAHISLVDFEFQKTAAETFECSGQLELSVSITELLKFLKRGKKGETLSLTYDENKKQLQMMFADASGSKEKIFTLNTIEIVSGKPPSPKISFESKARVNTDAFIEAIQDSSLVSDYLKVVIKPTEIIVSAKGEMGSSQTKLTKSSQALFELQAQGEVMAYFSLSYLDKILTAARSLSNELTIELSTNKPIKLGFFIPSGKLEYLVAPRIEAG